MVPLPDLTHSQDPVGVPIDPTLNVKELVDVSLRRLDDLRAADLHLNEVLRLAESRRIDEQAHLRSYYAEKLADAESARINAIRAVDVNAVAVASERAAAQATVLATQVAQSAEALRLLVGTTASTIAQQQAQSTSQFTERLALVERAQYEYAGRRTEADPVMARLLVEMQELRQNSSVTKGSRDTVAWLFAGFMTILSAVLGVAAFLKS